jgi:hypothetical protein
VAGYTILCSCGHTVKASVSFAMESQSGAHVTIRTRNCCPDCSREAKQKQPGHLAKSDEKVVVGPSALTGSSYQIVWAKDIRSQGIQAFFTFISRFPSDTRQTLHQTVLELMNRQTRAGWWIENQNNIYGALAVKCVNPLEAAILEMIRSQMNEIRPISYASLKRKL